MADTKNPSDCNAAASIHVHCGYTQMENTVLAAWPKAVGERITDVDQGFRWWPDVIARHNGEDRVEVYWCQGGDIKLESFGRGTEALLKIWNMLVQRQSEG